MLHPVGCGLLVSYIPENIFVAMRCTLRIYTTPAHSHLNNLWIHLVFNTLTEADIFHISLISFFAFFYLDKNI